MIEKVIALVEVAMSVTRNTHHQHHENTRASSTNDAPPQSSTEKYDGTQQHVPTAGNTSVFDTFKVYNVVQEVTLSHRSCTPVELLLLPGVWLPLQAPMPGPVW